MKHSEMLEDFGREITTLKSENIELRSKTTSLEGRVEDLTTDRVASEIRERIDRERNLIVIDVPKLGDGERDELWSALFW